MARDFPDDTTGRRIEHPLLIDPNAGAFSAHCLVYPTSFEVVVNSEHLIMHQNDGAGVGRNWLYAERDVASGKVSIHTFIGAVEITGSTDIQGRINDWISVGLSVSGGGAGSTSRVWVDGVDDGNTTMDPEAADGTHIIGEHKTTGGDKHWRGRIGECAYWKRELVANEWAALARGVNPRYLRTDRIVPIFGLQDPEPFYDLAGAGDTTTFGTIPPRANHPPVTLFTPKWAASMPFAGPTDFTAQNKRRSAFAPLPVLTLPPVPDGVID